LRERRVASAVRFVTILSRESRSATGPPIAAHTTGQRATPGLRTRRALDATAGAPNAQLSLAARRRRGPHRRVQDRREASPAGDGRRLHGRWRARNLGPVRSCGAVSPVPTLTIPPSPITTAAAVSSYAFRITGPAPPARLSR
jgi:hypothetical protein